jgi:hypothetical protein
VKIQSLQPPLLLLKAGWREGEGRALMSRRPTMSGSTNSPSLAPAERSLEPITHDDLTRLSDLARMDREDLFARKPLLSQRYAHRLVCVALCQGAALHYLDGRNGVKDFDVWTFYAEHPDGPFPYRRVGRRDFGPSKFGRMPNDIRPYVGRRVDLVARSLQEQPTAHPVEALRRYLQRSRTGSARALASKAVILIDPTSLRGVAAWPLTGGRD